MDILVSDEHVNCTPWKPYDERVCAFLDDWSKEIRAHSEAKAYPDVLTFGFFIRRGSVSKKKEEFNANNKRLRIGRGLAFHIAPSNVPVNCMYTLVFGLLAGCANIVRVPGRDFPQVDILCRTLERTLKKNKHRELKDRIQVIRYERNEKNLSGRPMTEFFSSVADVRVIWGGDETVNNIRSFPIGPRAKDITFPDRYSFAIISASAAANSSEEEIDRLATNFYNDTYLMDQNACSTPHIIAWRRDLEDGTDISAVYERFWRAVAREAKKYELADIKVSDKFADLCETAAEGEIANITRYEDNLLYVCDVDKLSSQTVEKCRGRFGMFFQKVFSDLDELKPVADDAKVQTCAVYGVDAKEVAGWIASSGLYGVDRVVPIGKTLDIGLIWDGYDLIGEMSRVIDF